MKNLVRIALALAAAGSALAHEGHAATQAHWHATDTAGFVVVALLAAAAVLLSRGD